MRLRPPPRIWLNWLPGLVLQSVIRDVFPIQLPSLRAWGRKEARNRSKKGQLTLAKEWRRILKDGMAVDQADLALKLGLSRARVSQV